MTYEKLKYEQGNFIMTLLNFAWISAVIIAIIFLLWGCQSGYKGEVLVVISKELSRLEEYKYNYELEGEWESQSFLAGNDYLYIYIHSNQDWNVGDTIHIGAHWGKKEE